MTAASGSAGRPGADDLTARILGLGCHVVCPHADQPETCRRTHPHCHWQGRLTRYYRSLVTPGQPGGARTPVGSADIAMILDWLD
jgi:hypothetical protein